MTPQSLIAFSPFLALLYVLYAFIQALRHKRQGVGAALLGFITLAVPLGSLILIQDATIRSEILVNLTLSAIIVFVAGFIILMIERRNHERDTSRSYGILGIAVGVLFAIATFIYPLLVPQSVTAGTGNAAALNTGGLQNVSQTAGGSAKSTAFVDVLTAQTGLTAEELTTKVEGGSTIASLVADNNGDLNAVITAGAAALDAMATQGGFASQMISNLGSDTTAAATQFVNGELNQRAQQALTRILLAAGNGSFQPAGQNGQGGGFPAANGTAVATPIQGTAVAESTVEPPAAVGQGQAATPLIADVVTAQTGLTAEELATQLQGGSTIADLVSTNNGDLDAVITATATALDGLATQGGFASQMLANLGSDTTAVATQFINGELDQRAQRLLTGLLVTGQAPSFGGGGQFPAGGGNGASGSGSGFGGGNFGSGAGAGAGTGAPAIQGASTEVAVQPTAQPTEVPATVMPTSPTVRPTLITFPTATPTPVETEVIGTGTASPDGQAAASNSQNPTCSILVNYNLNLRDKPNTTDSTVYLSIPFGTSVTADGRTRDDWYSVTYEGQAGWVSGEYVTTNSTCDNLKVVSG